MCSGNKLAPHQLCVRSNTGSLLVVLIPGSHGACLGGSSSQPNAIHYSMAMVRSWGWFPFKDVCFLWSPLNNPPGRVVNIENPEDQW